MADYPTNGLGVPTNDRPNNPFEREILNPDSPAHAGGMIARQQGVFALPHVITYSSVFSSAYRTYSWRWDEAYRNSQADALSMRRDAFLMGILQERQLASSQLKWHIECENPRDKRQKACAEFIANIIKRMRGLPKFFYNLQDAVWYGRCGQHLAYNWRKDVRRPEGIPGHPDHPGEVLVPERYYPIDGDKIQYRYRMTDDGPEVEDGIPVVLVHSAYGSRLPRGETVLTDRGRGLLLRSPYWRERFVIHSHIPDDADFFEAEMAGGIYGVGIRSRIYWLDWIRKEWMANVSDYIQRVGQGTIVLYYEAGNPQSEAAAIAVGNNISQQTVVVWPRPIGSEKAGSGIEVMSPAMSGSETLVRLMEHIEQIEERYIIGQTASSRAGAQGMGMHDISSMEDTKYRIARFDAVNAADTLSHDLITILMRWNCPEEDYRLWFVFNTDDPKVAERIDAAYKLFTMGAKLVEDPLLEVAGFPKADENDDVLWSIQGQQQLQAQEQAEQGLSQGVAAPPAPGGAPEAGANGQAAGPPTESEPIPPPSAMPGGHGGPRSPDLSAALGANLGAPGAAQGFSRVEQYGRKPVEWHATTTAAGKPALESPGGRIIHTPFPSKPSKSGLALPAQGKSLPQLETGKPAAPPPDLATDVGAVTGQRPEGGQKTDVQVGEGALRSSDQLEERGEFGEMTPEFKGGVWNELRSKPIKSVTANPEAGVNGSFVVEFDDGSSGVFKPVASERIHDEDGHLIRQAVKGNFAGREVAASEVAHILGVGHLLPETVIRQGVEGASGDVGSLQKFVPESQVASKHTTEDVKYDGPENLADAAVFDFLTMNQDRHSTNWMVSATGPPLTLIDNGFSFPDAHEPDPRYVTQSRLLGHAIEKSLPFPDLSQIKDKWPQVEESLKRNRMNEREIALTKKRFEFLTESQFDTFADFWSAAEALGVVALRREQLKYPESGDKTSGKKTVRNG